MSQSEPYPYYEEPGQYSFPGEMPMPSPVGFADPGISSLKANADHSHDTANDSGTVVQDKLLKVVGGWGAGLLTGTYVPVGNQPGLSINKGYSGTILRASFGCSAWAVALGNMYVGVSFTGTNAAITQVGVFYFNTTGDHRGFTGCHDVINMASGNYPVSYWLAGSVSFSTDSNDSFWGRITEVWP